MKEKYLSEWILIQSLYEYQSKAFELNFIKDFIKTLVQNKLVTDHSFSEGISLKKLLEPK